MGNVISIGGGAAKKHAPKPDFFGVNGERLLWELQDSIFTERFCGALSPRGFCNLFWALPTIIDRVVAARNAKYSESSPASGFIHTVHHTIMPSMMEDVCAMGSGVYRSSDFKGNLEYAGIGVTLVKNLAYPMPSYTSSRTPLDYEPLYWLPLGSLMLASTNYERVKYRTFKNYPEIRANLLFSPVWKHIPSIRNYYESIGIRL